MAQDYDVIVIGSGPAGREVASRSAKNGFSVALVESELIGGECHYWSCTPSKALLRPPEAINEALHVDGARQAVRGKLDVQAVLSRRDEYVDNWDDSRIKGIYEKKGNAIFRGVGRLGGARRVSVEGAGGSKIELAALQAVVICTGSRAHIPDIPGLAECKPWTNREATSAKRAPRRLVILGGGAVACEMAVAWSALGTEELTVVERSERLLNKYEPFAGKIMSGTFEARGISVRTTATVKLVERSNDGALRIALGDGSTLVADQILVAMGRKPNTDDAGLETVGISPGSWLQVDENCLVKGVSGHWLYAAGDVNNMALLTHMGKYQARACVAVIKEFAHGTASVEKVRQPWSAWTTTANVSAVPQVLFTDPQVAAVGLTQAKAKSLGLNVRAVDFEIGETDGAMHHADDYKGQARIVVDENRHVVIGATFVGPEVAELLHAATIAIVGEVPLERLWHAVPSFPTMSEIWLYLLKEYGL